MFPSAPIFGNAPLGAGSLAAGGIAQSLRSWNLDLGAFGAALGLPPVTYFEVLFALSGFLRLVAAVIFLPHIHEPEARPTREALRFMTANIYNNLFSAILLPLRVVGLRKRESFNAASARHRGEVAAR